MLEGLRRPQRLLIIQLFHKMKIKWWDLTESEKASFKNEAGSGWNEKLVPEFIYTSFSQHDFYYTRGGTLKDKAKADLYLLGYMLLDSANQDMIVKMFLYSIISGIYFLFASLFGVFSFRFGRYLTKEEILKND